MNCRCWLRWVLIRSRELKFEMLPSFASRKAIASPRPLRLRDWLPPVKRAFSTLIARLYLIRRSSRNCGDWRRHKDIEGYQISVIRYQEPEPERTWQLPAALCGHGGTYVILVNITHILYNPNKDEQSRPESGS